MPYQSRTLERISRDLSNSIEDQLERVGIFYRIFHRCKKEESLIKKMKTKGYDGVNTFLRDAIGIRINLYFRDDLRIVLDHLKKCFGDAFVELTMDKAGETEFKPTRTNLILRIPLELRREFRDQVADIRIDDTYEIQFRTVLSEGWHEVDHDLRYKCADDWEGNVELARFFNGILASLETSDFSIINLLDQLSYRHYKDGKWQAMLRTKFRLRISDDDNNQELSRLISSNPEIQKQLFKVDRSDFVRRILEGQYRFPITLGNVILMINAFYINDERISKLVPVDPETVFK